MSRDHFQSILSNFHVADDTQNPPFGWPGHNPLAKLQPMIDMISASFKTAYKPGKNISVDEVAVHGKAAEVQAVQPL